MNSLPGPRPTLAGLPDDIICELFKALADINPPQGPPLRQSLKPPYVQLEHNKPSPSLGWISLTHICRRLRNIGIGYLTALWGCTICVFPNAHAWETILARSRSASLVLDIRDVELRAIISWPLSDHVLARAHAIRDNINPKHPVGRQWWTNATLPSLKSLELAYDYGLDIMTGSSHSNPTGRLFAPALVEYKIRGSFISFQARSLRRLTVGHPVVWTTLLDSLRSCPLLESCTVHDTRETSNPAPVTVPPVPLLRLKHFSLFSPSDDSVCKLLNSLSIPPKTTVYGAHCHSPTVFRYLLALRRLADEPTSDNWLSILATRSLVDGTRHFRLSVMNHWQSKSISLKYCFPRHYPVDCAFERRSEPGIFDAAELVDMLEDAFSHDAALDIRILTFHDDCDQPNSVGPLPHSRDGLEQLGLALRAFAGITLLYVQRRSIPVLELLRDSLEEESEEGSVAEALFPELQTIVLDITAERLEESQWRVVMDILAYRKASGRPLERLVLMGTHLCHMSPDRDPGVTKLRVAIGPAKKLVGEVVDLRGGKRCTCGKYC